MMKIFACLLHFFVLNNTCIILWTVQCGLIVVFDCVCVCITHTCYGNMNLGTNRNIVCVIVWENGSIHNHKCLFTATKYTMYKKAATFLNTAGN